MDALGHLFAALRRARTDEFGGDVFADAVWLAGHMLHAVAPETAPDPGGRAAEKPPEAQEPGRSLEDSRPKTPGDGAAAGAPAQNAGGAGTTPLHAGEGHTTEALSVPVPSASALPASLEIARALRPLRRRLPSPRGYVVDEAATAQRIADLGLWLPVLHPTTERWLDLALVIDDSASMALWRSVARDLDRLLRASGAFRETRVYHLSSGGGRAQLHPGFPRPRAPRRTLRPETLVDPHGRRLVLVFTDMVAGGWYDGSVARLLSRWSATGMVSLVSPLPDSLWHRTALGSAAPTRMRRPLVAPFTPARLLADDAVPESRGKLLPVPVVSLDAAPLRLWARFFGRASATWPAGYLLDMTSGAAPVSAVGDGGGEISAEDRLDSFWTSSPTACRLACLLAASPVISLPVSRLIREAMVPEATLVQEAEVFLGDILEVVQGDLEVAPDEVLYDFYSGVRKLLLEAVPALDAHRVLAEVSGYVERHFGKLQGFRAFVLDPRGMPPEMEADDQGFAEIGLELLARFGEEYARAAERLRGVLRKAPAVDASPSYSGAPSISPTPRPIIGRVKPVDVLIVTAVPDEYAAVLAVETGAAPGSVWESRDGMAFRDFEAESGTLRVVVVHAQGMGGVHAAIVSADFIEKLGVRCLAMCGVCAGRRGAVELGDVIIADRVWEYDAGKRKLDVVDGKPVVTYQGDMEMYRIHPLEWTRAAERFAVDGEAAWLKLRPRTHEAQGDWILERVLAGNDPTKDPDRQTKCADFDTVLGRLRAKGFLKDGSLTMTAEGESHIKRVLLVNQGALPAATPFRVHMGPIASGQQVMDGEAVFARLSASVRKVLGVDMEVAAIGAVAWAKGLPYFVAAKGVMDHADADKSDNFGAFAARASAEVLLAFVRKHVPLRVREEDSILVTGTSLLPERAGPAALLNARHEVVPFYGHEDVLAEMHTWCEGGDKTVVARLVYAAGGTGKTRLGIELCRRMHERGWRAGFLRPGKALDELVESDRPVLAVLDYAESRPDLREMLGAALGRHPHKLRLLLLARNADQWWADLLRSDGVVGDMLREEEPVELLSMTADRDAVFLEAVKAFAGEPHKGVVPSLADPRYSRVLYIHAAALAVAQGRGVSVDALMEGALDHEERFWRQQLREQGHAGERRALHEMRLAVAALTLRGGASTKAEAEALIRDKNMLVLLRDLYPGRPPMYIGGLEPDMLGNAMVWRALRGEGANAGPYLDRVFDRANAEAIRTGFTVLGRLSEDHDEAGAWIARVLGHDVAGRALEAFAAAKTVGDRTAHAALGMELAKALERGGTAQLAERLEPALPHSGQTVSLREVGRWVLATRLAALPESMDEERARLANNLSIWQSALGQREEALASTQKAVDSYRNLASARPEAFLPNLATSLNNLGGILSELGQRQEALASTQEAVDSYRKLAAARPEAFLPDLAMSLNNVGARLSALGQREAALASTQEAVDIRRKLAASQADAFLPDLASSLNNLGNRQSELGQREEALASTQEAVGIRRMLATSRPEAFLPDLAMSLNNLGSRQSALNQRDMALTATQEAVDIYRRLAASRPEAFLPDLAMSLNNLGIRQSELGQREEALASTQEAVEIRRRLAASRPEAFLPDLAMSLNNLGIRQSELGQHEAALASTQEAVEIRRELVASGPEAFLPDLARSLNNMGVRQSELGQREAALASTQEAVDLLRKLATSGPEAFLPDLARSLNNMGARQSELGQREAALASAQVAVDSFRKLAASRPEAFLPDLAMSLNNLGGMQSALGQREAALASKQEAVDIRRKLAAWPDLARRPNNLGTTRQNELWQRPLDIGIVVALSEELRELLGLVGPYTPHHDADLDSYLFERGAYRCAVTLVGDMGEAQAARVTERLVALWDPGSIIVVGIAGGVDDDLRVGDVYVAPQAVQYIQDAKAAATPAGGFAIVPGAPAYRADYALLAAVRRFEFSHRDAHLTWLADGRADLASLFPAERVRERLIAREIVRSDPRLLADGHMATGPIVGAAAAFSAWIRTHDRNVKAVEMESAAVLLAAQTRGAPKRALAIRGISDYGDERKQALDRVGGGSLRKYAMRNAARLLLALLECGALPRESGATDGRVTGGNRREIGYAPGAHAPTDIEAMTQDQLFGTLCKLPEVELRTLIRKLDVPRDILPGAGAPPRDRVLALLEWAEERGRVADVEQLYLQVTGRAAPPVATAPPTGTGAPPAPAPPLPAPAPRAGDISDQGHEPVDFVIITAIEQERDALLSKLPGVLKLDRDGAGAHTYYEARVATRRRDGAAYRVIVTSLSGMGPIKGAIKAGAVVQRWKPRHVLLVGIAGGVEGEVAPGDVMVANQVADATVGKVRDGAPREERWMVYPADADLFDASLNFPTGWEDLIAGAPPVPATPVRHIGVIASGGDVVASKEVIGAYLADWPKLIGVEMEGGGVATGLHDDIARPRFLMIRGVSDLANGADNTGTKKAWRAYACHVAAAYAVGLLRDGPVPGTSPSATQGAR